MIRIRYFTETDTLYVELTDSEVAETHELNENTVLDLDAKGNLVGFTLEHARETVNIFDFSYQQIMQPQTMSQATAG